MNNIIIRGVFVALLVVLWFFTMRFFQSMHTTSNYAPAQIQNIVDPLSTRPSSPSPSLSPSSLTPCDESLWNYNGEGEEVIERCITITGSVVSMHPEKDGDENIQVQLDPQFAHLLNNLNITGQSGHLAVEPICENPPSRKAFKKACTGYISKLTMPHVGDHIAVTGSLDTDKGHGWHEIHPVTKIEIIR